MLLDLKEREVQTEGGLSAIIQAIDLSGEPDCIHGKILEGNEWRKVEWNGDGIARDSSGSANLTKDSRKFLDTIIQFKGERK